MAKAKQFMLLFWKNWTLGRRAPVRTLFEIGLPLFFILILVLLRAFSIKDEPMPSKEYTQFNVNKLPKGLQFNRNGQQWNFAFAPNTKHVQIVMASAAKQLNLNISKSGFKTEDELVSFLSSVPAKYLGGAYFQRTPDNANIEYKLRLSSRARNPRNSKAKMRLGGADPTTAWNTQLTFPVFQLPGPRSLDANHGGPPNYYDEGFLSIQHGIDMAILKYKGNSTPLINTTVGIRRYPYPAYIKDPFVIVIQQSLPLLLMLSLVFPALCIVRDIVHEKERKLKESMKIMGLNGWLHWAAWFTKYFIYLLITVIIGTVLFTTKFSSNGRVLTQSDPSVIFVFFLLFSISSIMFCFCISVFFSKASTAAAAGGIIWFCSYIPFFFITQYYNTMSLVVKVLFCLLSNCAMGMGSLLIGKFEGRGTGMQWNNLNEGVSVDDSMTLGLVLLMFVVDSFFYGLVTWYIEAVFPGEYGMPQPWYFPILRSYWCGSIREIDGDDHIYQNGSVSEGASPEFFEKEPVGLHAGVEVKNITKVFSTEKGKKIAVDRLSLNMYDGQITALLGHNGAGKTTLMSMLTGLFPPTSGMAVVNGCSITENLAGVRSSLGLCPQHNVLFDRLTVAEHLCFFATLKGCPSRRLAAEIDTMIQRIGLQDKRDTQTRALSGGMKRKLSVGMALIGGSKVVMLDEPTSGMDPSARRFTWDLLQQHREGRTILLTTHFMDEADHLGDRIAIMAEGRVKCCGSSLFLKNRYGVGYHMAIVKASNCKVSVVTQVVQSFVPTAQLESNVGAELSYILPSEATGKFEELFTELESRRNQLGIASFGASVTTLEEVFLKVSEEVDDSITKILRHDESESTDEEDILEEHAIAVNDNNRLGNFSGSSGYHHHSKHNYRYQLAFQRWYAMFVKRLLHSKRHKLAIISQLLLPLVFTLIALINAKTFPHPQDSPPLALNSSTFGKNVVLYSSTRLNGTPEALELAKVFKGQFRDSSSKPKLVKSNMTAFLIEEANRIGIGAFNLNHLIAASFQQKESSVNVTAWFNNQAYHSTAISLAAVQNGLLQAMLGTNHSLSTINHPLPRTTKDTLDDLSRNGVGFLISFNMLFGMAFLASSFVVFLVQERSNKAKHVQFVSGVDPISYWTSAYLWDLINFLLPALSVIILLAAFDVPAYSGERLGYTFLLLMIYGWAIIPLMYIFSFVFRTAANAFVTLTIFNIITGLATLLTVFILAIPSLDLLDVADALKWAFLVLPNYCLGQGIGDIFDNYNTITVFNKAVQECLKEFPFLPKKVCEERIKEFADGRLQYQDNYLAWENPGIGRYLIFMAWEGAFFFFVVLLLDYGIFRRFLLYFRPQPKMYISDELSSSTAEDDDVIDEKRRVALGENRDDVLLINDLTKVYRERLGRSSVLAVDHISLGVPLGECFGLLGINGAGKTTTFGMLTGDEPMTSGTAVVDSFDIRNNMNQVRQRIGYCPQFDALIDQMTGRELLFMYSRLRGIPEADIPQTVNDLIRSLLLADDADKITKSLSGGNKRKLSTAIALVGDPPVVFLDEPTTGMDPLARRLLWDALSRVRAEGRCIILTSHSMEECDALCTRLAIMVNGRFKCLGSPQHLKTKFGQGYTLLAKIGSIPPNTQPLKDFIEGSFPGSVLKDEHLGMVHYHITDTSVSWAQVFATIERVKLDFDIEDYSVSQTSLEQVFLNFARGQRQEDE